MTTEISRNVSVDAAANTLGVSRYTIRTWLRQRRLLFHRLRRRVVIAEVDLEQFLRANRVEAKERRIR